MLTLIRLLRHHFIKYKWYLILGTAFVLVSNLFSIYPAQVVRQAFDLVGVLVGLHKQLSGFAAQSQLESLLYKVLLFYGLIVLALAIIRGVFLFMVRQSLIVMSRKVEFDQKNELYNRYQQYSFRILRQQKTGDLMSRMSEDMSNVRMFVGPGIMYSLNTVSLFFMLLFIMLSVNVELTLYVMIPIPLMAFVLYKVHSIIVERSDAAQKQLSTLTSSVQEAFSGIRLLKSYGRESSFAGRYNEESVQFRERALDLARIDALFYPVIILLIGLSVLFIIWIGGAKVIAGTLTLGNIAEFIIYVNLLIWPVAALGWVTSLIQKAVASQRRIQEMLALTNEIQFPEIGDTPDDNSVSLRNVSFLYPETGIQALKDINVFVPSGSFVGIVGPTGSGKSTLAHLLVRYMDPDTGDVMLGGKNIKNLSRSRLAQTLSFVPQDVFLFSDSISNNIAFGKENASKEEIADAARFAGLYEDIMDFPQGMETLLGERGVTLSGGQKQRLSIARAYLMHNALMILDDSLSAVDTRTEEVILNQLLAPSDNGQSKRTLLLITHRLSALQKADQIWVIDDGKLVESGRFEELLSQNGLFARMVERQKLEEEIGQLT